MNVGNRPHAAAPEMTGPQVHWLESSPSFRSGFALSRMMQDSPRRLGGNSDFENRRLVFGASGGPPMDGCPHRTVVRGADRITENFIEKIASY